MAAVKGPFEADWDREGIMVSWHNEDGVYVHASPGAPDVIGWPVEKIVGRNPYGLLHPSDIPTIATYHEGLWNGRYGDSAVTFRIKGEDGEYRWIATETELLNTDGHGPVSVSRSRIARDTKVAAIIDRDDYVVFKFP